jgi:hypothetical protein
MEHLTGAKAASQNIAACMKPPANVRAHMVAEMATEESSGKKHQNESAQYAQLMHRVSGCCCE